MKNPYLKNKKTRKYGTPFKDQKDSISGRKAFFPDSSPKPKSSKSTQKSLKKLTPQNEGLMTLNSTEKNPIIYPSTLKNFVHKRRILLSPQELSRLSMNMNKKVTSFDDRLRTKSEGSGSYNEMGNPKKGILRWDDFSFMNKESISTAEIKNIKKKLKDKKLVKSIKWYRESKKNAVNSVCSIDKERKSSGSDDTSDTNRKDVFGNSIKKGGTTHRVCFSFHGDMKVVENWKELNRLNSIKPDKSLAMLEEEEEKKKCVIF